MKSKIFLVVLCSALTIPFLFCSVLEAKQKRSFPKTTGVSGTGARSPNHSSAGRNSNSGSRGNTNRGNTSRGNTSKGNSGHGRSNRGHSGHNHRSNYNHGQHSSYRYPSHTHNRPRGYSQFNVNPYGGGFSYQTNGFGITIGSRYAGGVSRYYRPTYNDYYGRNYVNPYNNLYSNPYQGVVPTYVPNPNVYETSGRSVFIDSTEPTTDALMNQALIEQLDQTTSRVTEARNFPIIHTNANAVRSQQLAEDAFKAARYSDAVGYAKQAVGLDDRNGLLYLFSSQTNFSIENYEAAAADLANAMQLLPEEQWSYVIKNFRQFYGQNDYVAQTDKLSVHLANNPLDLYAHMLRGYHYGALGYPDAASADFQSAINIEPENSMARKLMSVFGGKNELVDPQEIKQPVPQQRMAPDLAPANQSPILEAPGKNPDLPVDVKPNSVLDPAGAPQSEQPPGVLRLVPEDTPPELTGSSR